MPAPPTTRVSANLDLLRTIAVLSVFLSHLLAGLGLRDFGSLGRFGVIMFFVHTSFVLMSSLQRLEAPSRNFGTLVKVFYIRRLFRIYPLAIFFVTITALLHLPGNTGVPYTWIGAKAFLSNLALTQNLTYSPNILSPLWSLPLEIQMYIMLPFAFLLIRGQRKFRSVPLWVCSVLAALILPRLSGRLGVFLYAPCFSSGILAFDLLRSRSSTWKLPSWVWPIGLLLSIALFGPHDNVSLAFKIPRAWALSLFLAVLYACTEEAPRHPLQAALHWVAEHSYGIYLSHIILIALTVDDMLDSPVWVRVLFLTTSAVGIPALLYVTIEKPFINLGANLSKRLSRSEVRQKQYA